MSEFNPYSEWLGIPSENCPPNFYQLLDISPNETDSEVIDHSFESRLARIRSFQSGPRGKYTAPILNELTQARLCLVDPSKRTAYDMSLASNRSKPPVAVENLSGGGVPPIVLDHTPQPPVNTREDGQISSSRSILRPLNLLYALACIGLIAFLFFLNRATDNSAGVANDPVSAEKTDSPSKLPGKKASSIPPDPDVPLTGIAAGPNNEFELDGSNALIEQPHPELVDSKPQSILINWKPAESEAKWKVWIDEPGYYEAIISYLATSNSNFSKIALQADDRFPRKTDMRSSDEDRLFSEEFVLLFKTKGEHTLKFYVEGDIGDFRFRSISLRPNQTRKP